VILRLREHREHSLNLRGAYLHVLSDLLGSIGAVIAGAVIVFTGANVADAVVSLLIAALSCSARGAWCAKRSMC
jgi:cobalt-zinc-cadmium efflux system protein